MTERQLYTGLGFMLGCALIFLFVLYMLPKQPPESRLLPPVTEACDYLRYDLPTASEEIENNFRSNGGRCINADSMRHILHRLDK